MTRPIDRRSAFGAIAGTATIFSQMARASDAPGAAPMNLAQQLAGYVAGTGPGALDAATIETAKAHFIDAIGCGIAAFGETPVRACRDVALALPGGPATVIGTRQRTSPDLAAFANGVALRYYDFNDVYVGREPGHPSDNITACLAIAEAEGRSGRDLLLSIVLAYEIACRLMDAAELTRRGWDHPIYSLPASALAAGRLMKLPAEQLAEAVNLAISGHLALNQTRVQVLSDWKGIADANAARNGVFAALLARRGVTGPSPIFEGHAGLFKQVSGPFELDIDQFGGRAGRFRINDCGVKLYPAQGGTLTAIPAAAKVAAEVGDLGRIQAIEVATANFTYLSAGKDPEKWKPETKETADHSLPYVVARAMLDGDITNDSYAPAAIRDPAVRALMAKITVKPDDALTALTPKALPNRVTATLTDGRTVSHQVDALPGFVGKPMQRSDFEQKFRRNVAKVWSDARQREVLDHLWNLERADKLDRLFELLVINR
ncbi:MAG: MmgE/PrpD family protein [Pseudomonadota bacterium]